jgi:hypothetical protein
LSGGGFRLLTAAFPGISILPTAASVSETLLPGGSWRFRTPLLPGGYFWGISFCLAWPSREHFLVARQLAYSKHSILLLTAGVSRHSILLPAAKLAFQRIFLLAAAVSGVRHSEAAGVFETSLFCCSGVSGISLPAAAGNSEGHLLVVGSSWRIQCSTVVV